MGREEWGDPETVVRTEQRQAWEEASGATSHSCTDRALKGNRILRWRTLAEPIRGVWQGVFAVC